MKNMKKTSRWAACPSTVRIFGVKGHHIHSWFSASTVSEVENRECGCECEGHDEERQTFDGQDQISAPCLSQFVKEDVTFDNKNPHVNNKRWSI